MHQTQGVISLTVYKLTDYALSTSASGTVAWGPWQAGIIDALSLGPDNIDFRFSVFGRNSRFTFGGTYGFGRMRYATFGLPKVKLPLSVDL